MTLRVSTVAVAEKARESRPLPNRAQAVASTTRDESSGSALTRHVLVVEDDSPIRAMVTDLLEDAGYGVLQAADGFEALRLLRERRPDLIILDLMLPRMSGWQFLERSREDLDRDHIPVLILSAIKGFGDYPSTLGVAGWLTKPLDVDRFLRAVEELAGPPRRAPGPNPPSQAMARILVVEDDSPIRNMLVEHLTHEGYAVDAAGSTEQAIERMAEALPDLVLLDLMLPGRSGWDFLRERGHDPRLSKIRVLVLSAAPGNLLVEAKQLGADAFVSKPFDLDVLGAMVQSFVS